jgi:hypothetical protein
LKRMLAAVSALLLLAALPLQAKTKPKPSKAAAPDPNYVAALATADHFLHAWQMQDHEAGLVMLTDSAKRQNSDEHLQNYFSRGSATEQAYEVGHGTRLKAGRYAFPVTLVVATTGKERAPSRRFSQIIVIRTSKEDWAVDKLP